MKSCIKVKLLILLFMSTISSVSFSQGFSPYYTNPKYQKYLNYLISSGKLKVDHPLSQPYNVTELADSLSETLPLRSAPSALRPYSWLSLLRNDLNKRYSKTENQDSIKGNMIIGFDAENRNSYKEKTNTNDFSGSGFASYAYKNIGFYSSITVDEAYKRDTMYFGTTGKLENKVSSRSNESYLQWENKNFILFAGRINRNYGLAGENSLILSNQSFSFDHLAFTFKNKVLKYTSLFGRLNDIYGFDVRDSVPKNQWSKRFLNIHRFEISLSEKIEIAFTDVILFGGKDAFPQFQYLNPVSFLFMSKMNDRKGYEEGNANALMCFDIFCKPSDNLTLSGQFLIDDMDFTKSLREIYPDRIGYSVKAIYTDLFPASQISLSYKRISNWTYNSFYTWGNYTFYGRSLGYPRNGTENLKLGFDSFKFFPFMLGFEFLAEQYRVQDLNAPFIAVKTDFPVGTPQKALSFRVNTTYIPNHFVSANLTAEYINYGNYGFVESQRRSFINIFLSIKVQGIFRLF
jgi:hypothetical protein